MRTVVYSTELLISFFGEHVIGTMPELKNALGTEVPMTVFRKLRALSYRTSFSHRGSYYTLDKVARFDQNGLWFFRSVGFSVYGTLLKTVRALVEKSESGLTAAELKLVVKVEVKEPLLRLFENKQLHREKMMGVYVYFSHETFGRRKQVMLRKDRESETTAGLENLKGELLAHELKAAVVIFFSLLDEKPRRHRLSSTRP